MAIEVLEAAPDKLLTTVAAVKTTLGITVDTQDDLIEDMIGAASDFVVTYTGRDFALQSVRETMPGKGVPELLLSLTPVVSVESVELDDAEIDGWVLQDPDVGTIFRRSGFYDTSLKQTNMDNAPSNWYENRYAVTYEGGYVLPNWGLSQGTRNFPRDLERAVIDIVKTMVFTSKQDGTMKSYKIGDTSITWDRSMTSDSQLAGLVPSSALAVLNYYRRPF